MLVSVIYIDRSPLCLQGMRALLGDEVFCFSFPSINLLQVIKNIPNVVIMDFPNKIYLFDDYLTFINHARKMNSDVKILFFIDKVSPIVLSLIARATPDIILDKHDDLSVVKRVCMALIRHEVPDDVSYQWMKSKVTAITRGEALVLCETARAEGIENTARRLNLNPKTVYSHLSNASKKFGIRNRVELLKMLALL
ncbi:helix-turn-helix transcriptional regulator [Serratia liquefaciens]|uniref:helix-turn-helix transcriptional regulator n=1 Tax=Serratia liquefaciens TaxID=614 RepID=UPI000D511D24|nr:LuxR C-terminal-related transcriptional regulator [Serratia liquefaciens]NLU15250.1 response regulator transcription factor [Serratia liquefaciens]PVD44707.1 LuxR family transcriptional regulator [Serratia liquefaciens]QHT53490.1 response regulator transcription factor [Serratia liquefaciens]QIC89582.1 response regulator transcription factor [Serratia liquefaciens]WBL75186.1 LuxR C-terminal-related transcriptional regulator [Serratia liquefaciens]